MLIVVLAVLWHTTWSNAASYQVAVFSADVTIPLNHRCMGVLPTKSKRVLDPLYARGFVFLGAKQPIVLVAVDWCEIRNRSYDQWRDRLAAAAGTDRNHVMVCSVHQHDAPVVDLGAEELLAEVGLAGELFDRNFHRQALERVADAVGTALKHPLQVTHFGVGEATVEGIASNRRVVHDDGRVGFDRSSASGGNAFYRDAPVGEIDPRLKTLSFWNGRQPVLALHSYATHPMSYYGRGEVSSDFVGLARQMRQEDDPHVFQIYATGCSGDTTAGKYNDGSPEDRVKLTRRLHQAMVDAWENTRRIALEHVSFRHTTFQLAFPDYEWLREDSLTGVLRDAGRTTEERILAAMGLSSLRRLARGQPIDLPCMDFGTAQIVLLPGESFVGFQLMAQQLRPDSFVMAIGFGECWPGYVPTDAAVAEQFSDKWQWAGPGSESRVRRALEQVLLAR
jgi:hypothetical protein